MFVHPLRTAASRLSPRTTKLATLAALALVALAIAPAAASAYIYWTNPGTGSIGRANLDGGHADESFISLPNGFPEGLAVDAGHIYWVSHSISRANLDGSGVVDRFVADPGFATGGVAVDAAHIYWANIFWDSISRANLDGSGTLDVLLNSVDVVSIAVDDHYIYWTKLDGLEGGTSIGRANLDGSGVDHQFITGGTPEGGLAVDADHIYWANNLHGTIGRANLDGSGVDQSFITATGVGEVGPYDPAFPTARGFGVAVDDRYIYWTNPGAGKIGRANLDGSSANPSLITGAADESRSIAVDALHPLPPPNTRIRSASINRVKRKARFSFSSSQPRSSFRCSLDGKTFKRCRSPKTYRHLTKGKHTFRVKARNSQGTLDRSPAKRRFRI